MLRGSACRSKLQAVSLHSVTLSSIEDISSKFPGHKAKQHLIISASMHHGVKASTESASAALGVLLHVRQVLSGHLQGHFGEERVSGGMPCRPKSLEEDLQVINASKPFSMPPQISCQDTRVAVPQCGTHHVDHGNHC